MSAQIAAQHIPHGVHACAELPEHLLNAPDSTHQGALRNDVHHVGFRSGCSTASSPCSEGLCLMGVPQHPDSRGAPTPKRLRHTTNADVIAGQRSAAPAASSTSNWEQSRVGSLLLHRRQPIQSSAVYGAPTSKTSLILRTSANRAPRHQAAVAFMRSARKEFT